MREENCSFVNRHGQALSGVLHHPHADAPQGGVILCHGMESNKESDKLVLLSRELAQRNVLALRFDFACAGETGILLYDLVLIGLIITMGCSRRSPTAARSKICKRPFHSCAIITRER